MQIGLGLGLTMPRIVAGVDPLAALYGTGLGQIPLHLAPEDAVLDGSGNVLSVPNRGGAGALFDTVAAGSLTRNNGLFNVVTDAALTFGVDLDMMGVRTFIVARKASSASFQVAGKTGASAIRLAIQWDNPSQETIYAWHDPGINTEVVPKWNDDTTKLRLYEIEMVADTYGRVFVSGEYKGAFDAPLTGPSFPINRLLKGPNDTTPFKGDFGQVLSVITDGSPALDPVMLSVRQALAAKHGIALG